MTTISDYSEQAQLSQAAYADNEFRTEFRGQYMYFETKKILYTTAW